MSTLLRGETQRYQVLRERLLATWPELDCYTLADTLEGITDLHEMIAAVIRSALVDEALQAGLRTRLEDMRRRLERLEERGAKKRQLALVPLPLSWSPKPPFLKTTGYRSHLSSIANLCSQR